MTYHMHMLLHLVFIALLTIAPATAQTGSNQSGTGTGFTGFANSSGSNDDRITLKVETGEFRSVRGSLFIELSDAGGETLSAEIHPVTGSTVTVRFDSLTPGPKTVRLFHDKNSNGELDTNFLGIPTEGYGFSNNQRSRFGPPPYEDRLFDHRQDTTISISLIYW